MKEKIDELILGSLSFYTPLTLDQIILDLDPKQVKSIPEFNLDILEKRIKFFIKAKKIKVSKSKNQVTYIKIFPRRRVSLKRFLQNILDSTRQNVAKLFS